MITAKLMLALTWVMNFVILNALFVLGALVGGIILGLFPSMQATIETCKKLFEQSDIGIFKFFVKSYRGSFKTSLKYGYLGLIISFVAFSNLVFWHQLWLENYDMLVAIILRIVWLVMFFYTVLCNLITVPLVIRDNLSMRKAGKLFLLCLGQIHLVLLLAVGLVIIYVGLLYFTGLFIFFVGSLTMSWIMFVNHLFIKRVYKLQGKNFEEACD